MVRHGPGTLTISLPAKWAKRHCISDKDELELEEKEKKLIVHATEDKAEHKRVEVDLSGLNEKAVGWILCLLYKQGYDEICASYNSLKVMKVIQERTRTNLLGFIIAEQNKNSCLLKCVSRELKGEFDKGLRRAFLVTLSLAESSLELIKKGDYVNLKDLATLETSNNQLTNFCERILNKYPSDEEGTTFKYVIVWQLEKIADEYNEILKLLAEKRDKIDDALITLYEKTNVLLRKYYEAHYKMELKRMQDILDGHKEVKKLMKDNVRTKNHNDLMLVHHLLRIGSRITELSPSTIAANKLFENRIS